MLVNQWWFIDIVCFVFGLFYMSSVDDFGHRYEKLDFRAFRDLLLLLCVGITNRLLQKIIILSF